MVASYHLVVVAVACCSSHGRVRGWVPFLSVILPSLVIGSFIVKVHSVGCAKQAAGFGWGITSWLLPGGLGWSWVSSCKIVHWRRWMQTSSPCAWSCVHPWLAAQQNQHLSTIWQPEPSPWTWAKDFLCEGAEQRSGHKMLASCLQRRIYHCSQCPPEQCMHHLHPLGTESSEPS